MKEKRKKRYSEFFRGWIVIFFVIICIGLICFQQIEIQALKERIFDFPQKELARLKDSVVILGFQLFLPGGQELKKIGIGTVIEINKEKYILSVYHHLDQWGKELISLEFLKKNLTIFILSGEGKGKKISFWDADPRFDFILLKLPQDLRYPAIPLGNSAKLSIGEEIIQISFNSKEEDIEIKRGNIISVKASRPIMNFLSQQKVELGEKDIFKISLPGYEGESGAPVLVFQDGKLKLIGIHAGSTSHRFDQINIPRTSWAYKLNPILTHAKTKLAQ